MRSFKANAFVYLVGFAFALWLSGCGGSGTLGGGGGNSNPTVSSVALTGITASLQAGATAQAVCTVTMSDGTTNSNCTFASDATAVASIGTTTGTVTAIAPGTTHLTATSTKDSTKSSSPFTLTVTAVPATITTVTVTANPTTITTARTSVCTATITGTGAFSSVVTWTATDGTIVAGANNTATLTPAGVGPATCTAKSTQDSTKSGSATVTVTRATPTVTSATIIGSPWLFCPISCGAAIGTIVLNGTGLKTDDTVSTNNYWPTLPLASVNVNADGTQAAFYEQFGDSQWPGPISFSVVPTDGTPASNTVTFAYLNGYNSASHGPNGELINQGVRETYLWQNTSGTWTNPVSFGSSGLNTVYETDETNAYFVNNFSWFTLDGTPLNSAAPYDGWEPSGTSAENGTVSIVEPGGNEVTLYHPNGNNIAQTNSIPAGIMPYTSVMATIGGTTYEFVASVDGTPTLWRFDTNGGSAGSVSLIEITSLSNIRAAGHVAGGWPMAVFHKGTAAGKIAFVSTYDQKLLVYDGTNNSLPLLKTVSLPCAIPSAVDAIDATGHFVVSCIQTGTSSGTTFLDVDPIAGTATPLKSTSKKFPLGFLADTNNLYIFYGSGAPDVQPNR
jgi:hypothetical protein